MIILLILCLPLILMLSLFTTTSVVSIAVDVPVNGIEIAVEEMVELDLDKGESLDIEYRITPTEATKKDVTVSFSEIGENKLAEFAVDGTKITPTSYGYARVTLETADGGYRDSFDVAVYSKRVESISSSPVNDTVVVGGYTEIKTDFYPVIASNKALSYRVKEGADVATVSAGGKIHGIGIGTAVIEVASSDNPETKCDLTVNVVSSGVIDFVSDTSYLTSLENSGEILAVLNPDITVESYEITLLDENGAELTSADVTAVFDTAAGNIAYTFVNESYVGRVEIQLTVTPEGDDPVTKSCYVERVSEIRVDWANWGNGSFDVSGSEPTRIGIDLAPLGADVSYSVILNYKNSAGESKTMQLNSITEGETCVCDGGYISIRLEKDSGGVDLVVTREAVPGWSEFANNFTITSISLSVKDNHTGEVTPLREISVVAIP